MKTTFGTSGWRFFYYFLALSAGLILVLFNATFATWLLPSLSTVLKVDQLEKIINDLGTALLATVVVTASVGEISLKMLATEIQNKLQIKLRTVFDDTRLPAMLERIFNPVFVRPSYSLSLFLEALSGYPDLLKVTVKTKYKVKNVSGDESEYPVGAWLDDVIKLPGTQHDVTGFTNLTCRYDRATEQEIFKPDINYFQKREENMVSITVSTPRIKPQEVIDVVVEGVQLMRIADHFVWNMATVTGEMEIVIQTSEDLDFAKFDVFPRAMHHIDHKDFIQTLHSDSTNRSMTWTIKHVLLPYQGIELRWSSK